VLQCTADAEDESARQWLIRIVSPRRPNTGKPFQLGDNLQAAAVKAVSRRKTLQKHDTKKDIWEETMEDGNERSLL
jgi:hypothetical protein